MLKSTRTWGLMAEKIVFEEMYSFEVDFVDFPFKLNKIYNPDLSSLKDFVFILFKMIFFNSSEESFVNPGIMAVFP